MYKNLLSFCQVTYEDGQIYLTAAT